MAAAEKIRAWREASGLSQRAAAEQASMSQAAWCEYETGAMTNPAADIVQAFDRLTAGTVHHITLGDWQARPGPRRAKRPSGKQRRAHGDGR
jgi:transcriptional regulator with XRE-family HTH domain